MKKFLGFMMVAFIVATGFTSCNGDDDGPDPVVVKASPIKTISFFADWAGGTEMWEFSYDAATKKVSQYLNYWDGALDKTVTYDYSVAGKLTLKKDGEFYREYDINADGYITKDYDSGDTYTYDANGYLVKLYEGWSGAPVLKYDITVTNGNIMKITTYDDDGTTKKKIKEFTYTSGDNVNNIHQANAIDSDWKPVGNFYGKASVKLVDFFEYWDPRENPIVKKKSSLVYTFDTKERPSKVVKSLTDGTTEEWSYTYYEE